MTNQVHGEKQMTLSKAESYRNQIYLSLSPLAFVCRGKYIIVCSIFQGNVAFSSQGDRIALTKIEQMISKSRSLVIRRRE